jgi:spore coat protein A, manganese oxidase
MTHKWTRRKTLKLGLASGGALLLPSLLQKRANSQDSTWLSPPMQPFQRTFRVPPVLAPIGSDNIAGSNGIQSFTGTDYYEVTIRRGSTEILPGKLTEFWTYGGSAPGPTIRQRRDRQSVVRFINNMGNDNNGVPIATSVHLHGMASLPQYDGWANDLTPTGYYKDYIYPNNRAATLWYHDHAVHVTSRNAYMGLAGMYQVQDDFELNLGLPSGAYDVPLVLSDKILNPDGSLYFNPEEVQNFWGDIILVNGVPWPKMTVERRKYRFRILNTGITRAYNLSLSNGAPITVIGTDAGLIAAPASTPNLVVGVAERYEIVIDFAQYPNGTSIVLQNGDLKNHQQYAQTNVIMRFDVTGQTAVKEAALPATLRPVQPIDPATAVRTREFVFERQNGLWTINGLTWDPARADANPGLGDVEIWRLVNGGGGWNHPIHIHLIDFQLLSRSDGGVKNYERGWKDVTYLGEGQTIDVIMRFGPHNGKYMMHCHNLIHEDHDMMTNFQVGQGGPDPVTSAPAKPLPAPPLFETTTTTSPTPGRKPK